MARKYGRRGQIIARSARADSAAADMSLKERLLGDARAGTVYTNQEDELIDSFKTKDENAYSFIGDQLRSQLAVMGVPLPLGWNQAVGAAIGIKRLQELLVSRGYNINIDSIFGPETEGAATDFFSPKEKSGETPFLSDETY